MTKTQLFFTGVFSTLLSVAAAAQKQDVNTGVSKKLQ